MHGTVRAALCTDVVTIRPEATLSAAHKLIVDHQAPELYVVSPCGLLLGILPDYEILKLNLLGGIPTASPVSELMATRFETATLDTPLGEVACRLRVNVHSRVPVIDAGRLVGFVSRRELLAVLLGTGVDMGFPRASTEVEPEFPRQTPCAPNFLRNVRLVPSEPGV